MSDEKWFIPNQTDDLISPALLFYPERILENIEQMIRIAGGPERLWPHVKTHKNEEIIRMQLEAGIEKFKCSTLTEADLLGRCGAKEALLAMQPTTAHLKIFVQLAKTYPKTSFSTLVDNTGTFDHMRQLAEAEGRRIRLWMDVNSGMNRTGIVPGEEAIALFERMNEDPWIECMGLHVYDGHLRDENLEDRRKRRQKAMGPVREMQKKIESRNLKIKSIIAGGSPSFTLHAEDRDLCLSPGTTLLWDAGYGGKFPDLPFKPAAVLFTRVVSRPDKGLVCTDLGHKSVASEMGFPRVKFLNLDDCEQISQSEEHLVLRCSDDESHPTGTKLFALPIHICPTVAKYEKAHIVVENELRGTWTISARDHDIELINR